MPKYKLIVMTDAVDGQDQEYNRWYDDVHLPDVFKVPGVTGAERYRFQTGGSWKYLAIYELDCDDPAAVEQELQARAGTDLMPMTDTIDLSNLFMGAAEVITPYRSA